MLEQNWGEMAFESLRDFLESAPLYTKLKEHLPSTEEAARVAVVDQYCPVCQTMRPFRLPGTSKETPPRIPLPASPMPSTSLKAPKPMPVNDLQGNA